MFAAIVHINSPLVGNKTVNNSSHSPQAQHIAILLPSLAGGGAERSMLHLAQAFSCEGRRVDLLLFRAEGAYMNQVPETVRVVELSAGSSLGGRLLALQADPVGIGVLLKPVLLPFKVDANIRHINSLKLYLETQQPDVVLSALTYTNLTALWAKRLASLKIPVIVSERIALSAHQELEGIQRHGRWRWRYIMPMVKRSYQYADGIVTVSDDVKNDLAENIHIDRNTLTTIYNPVVDETLLELAAEPLCHPWFEPGQPPVILGVGRLIPQKDFATLLHAFALLCANKDARLVILGEGRQRTELVALAQELGITDNLDMPGFVDNPYQYMAGASVFALSSLYEGLPGVLIQALACGCPVVSTDCPGGSAEILEHGKFGRLVPIHNPKAFADAMRAALENTDDKAQLKQRASAFSVRNAARSYLELMDNIVEQCGI